MSYLYGAIAQAQIYQILCIKVPPLEVVLSYLNSIRPQISLFLQFSTFRPHVDFLCLFVQEAIWNAKMSAPQKAPNAILPLALDCACGMCLNLFFFGSMHISHLEFDADKWLLAVPLFFTLPNLDCFLESFVFLSRLSLSLSLFRSMKLCFYVL